MRRTILIIAVAPVVDAPADALTGTAAQGAVLVIDGKIGLASATFHVVETPPITVKLAGPLPERYGRTMDLR